MLKQRFSEARSHSPTPTGTYANMNGTSPGVSAVPVVNEQNRTVRGTLIANNGPFSPVLTNGLLELDTLLQDLNTDQLIKRVQGSFGKQASWSSQEQSVTNGLAGEEKRNFDRAGFNGMPIDGQSRVSSGKYEIVHETNSNPVIVAVQPNPLDTNGNFTSILSPRPQPRTVELDSLIASLNALETTPATPRNGTLPTTPSIASPLSPTVPSLRRPIVNSASWAGNMSGRIGLAGEANPTEVATAKRSGSPHVKFADELVKVIPLSSTPPALGETQETQAKPSTLKRSPSGAGTIGRSPAETVGVSRTSSISNAAPNVNTGHIASPSNTFVQSAIPATNIAMQSSGSGSASAGQVELLSPPAMATVTSDSASISSSYFEDGDVYDTLDMYHSTKVTSMSTSMSTGNSNSSPNGSILVKSKVNGVEPGQRLYDEPMSPPLVDDIPQRIVPIGATASSTATSQSNVSLSRNETSTLTIAVQSPQTESELITSNLLIEPPLQYQSTNGRFDPVTVLLHLPSGTLKRNRPMSVAEPDNQTQLLMATQPASAYDLQTQPHSADSLEPPNRQPSGSGVACQACGEQLTGSAISAIGKFWHPEHFRCSVCHDVIGTRRFFERLGEPHCEFCYLERIAPRCAQCDRPILDKCVTALGKCWHYEHFVCASCNCLFDPNTGFLEHAGRAYCTEDYYSLFGQKCAACNRAIGAETFVSAFGKRFHRNCWTCAQCGSVVDPAAPFGELDGRPVCERHLAATSSSSASASGLPNCFKCGNSINNRCITALSRKYHVECFTCSSCFRSLGNGFRERDGKPFCSVCFSKQLK